MKTISYYRAIRIIPITCIAILASCASDYSEDIPTTIQMENETVGFTSGRTLEEQLFSNINRYRRSQGKSDLIRHAGLDRLALEHSEYQRSHRGTFSLVGKNISHYAFESRARYARVYYNMVCTGENVAATNPNGGDSGALLVRLWSNSKSHNANMLDNWTYTGIGIVVDSDGMVFATQLFGAPEAEAPNMYRREQYNIF